jgi:hypothetical protein
VKKKNLNVKVIGWSQLKKGIKIEQEHAYAKHSLSRLLTIVSEHLSEYPDYYDRLVKMEKDAEEYWKGKKKPSIYN